MIWEMAVIPFLLNNSSTWFSMKKTDIERLSKLQNLFFSVLFKVQHSPAPSFLWDCQTLTMSNRILKSKLMLCHHILSLPSSAVAHQVLLEQIRLRLPGLWLVIEEFIIVHKVSDVTNFSKKQWKDLINEIIMEQNKNDLISLMKKSSKIRQSNILDESYEFKNYIRDLSREYARVQFRQRYFMIKEAKLNFPSDPQFKAQGFQCDYCPAISSQSHIKVCKEYLFLREGRNLEIDSELVQYFVEVVKYRQDRAEDDDE